MTGVQTCALPISANAQVETGKYSQALQAAQEDAAYQAAMQGEIIDSQADHIREAHRTLQQQHNILTQMYPDNLANLDEAMQQPDPAFAFVQQTTNNIHDNLYKMNKQQPTRVGIAPVTSHKIAFKGKRLKEPEVRRGARVLTKTGRQKYNRAIFAKQAREASIMQDDEPVPGKKKEGKGWADAARAFAPFMQTGFKVYQNHQYNEAARRKREMLAERLGVSPYDLEGLSSRGLLE